MSSTHRSCRRSADVSSSSSRPSSPASGVPKPQLSVNAPHHATLLSSPKLDAVWGLVDGLFASSTPRASRHVCPHERSDAAQSAIPRDLTTASAPSQFAALSESRLSLSAPHRSTTYSCVSSNACSSGSSPATHKMRSRNCIKLPASALVCESEPSSSTSTYSTIPVPKWIKTEQRDNFKAKQETEFDKVFLAQEIRVASSGQKAGNSNRYAPLPGHLTLAQGELPVTGNVKPRRKRSCWAIRHSDSPHGSHNGDSTSDEVDAARSSVEQEVAEPLHVQPPSLDRQFSSSSHSSIISSTSTGLSHASEAISPRSPCLNGRLEASQAFKVKRNKATSPKHKIYGLQFSLDGRYLAVAGSDRVVRVYEVIASPADRAAEIETAQMQRAEQACQSAYPRVVRAAGRSDTNMKVCGAIPEVAPVFKSTPIRVFTGHTGDVLDLSWSKNNFLLSCGTDKTAKLWHPKRSECLCTFSTSATVSSIDFHPTDDRFFVTGGLDGKLRLWNVTTRRVQSINNVPGFITAVAFSSSGSSVCVGTHSGSIVAFSCSDTLTYINSLQVKSVRARKSAQASKITSIEPVQRDASSRPSNATATTQDYMTVTSNDSHVRIYSIASRRLIWRLTSARYTNRNSQIRATSSSDSRFVVSGSENASIHIWSLSSDASLSTGLFARIKGSRSSLKSRGRKGAWNAGNNSTGWSWQAGTDSVRCAIFAPAATSKLLALAHDPLEIHQSEKNSTFRSRIIVSTDDTNVIRTWRSDPFDCLI